MIALRAIFMVYLWYITGIQNSFVRIPSVKFDPEYFFFWNFPKKKKQSIKEDLDLE